MKLSTFICYIELRIGSVHPKCMLILVYSSLNRIHVHWCQFALVHVQRAARYVINRQRNTSSVGDMLHLECRSLEDRRRDARLVMMYKISHNKVAVSKSDRLSPHYRNMHSRSYQVPLCRTQRRTASFSPRTTVDWNCLPQTAVLSDSVELFRTAITTSHP